MKRKSIIYIIIVSILVSLIVSCRGFSNTFFCMLLNTPSINIQLEFTNRSLLDELCEDGIYYEIYKIKNPRVKDIINNVENVILFDSIYNKYERFCWKKYIPEKDSLEVNNFLMGITNIECKGENDIRKIVDEGGFYYTILFDKIRKERLFIISKSSEKIYYVSKYEL